MGEALPTSLRGIAEKAARDSKHRFGNLFGLLNPSFLVDSWRFLNKRSAPGIDRVDAREYGPDLQGHVEDLVERLQTGRYHAKLVRCQYIPKGKNEQRPLGIPTLEDKVLQRGVAMLLEPIYEQDFYDSSYGFRPGRSAHQALDALWQQAMDQQGGYIVEVDIQHFFDTLDRKHLRTFLQQRINDGVVLRLIGKWLHAGVLDKGQLHFPEAGSPQGGVISPLLSNVYLHYVLDEWFEQQIKPCLKGTAYLVRYGDDFVLGFTQQEDAQRMMAVLPKRFGKYGLTLHSDKTRLIPFQRPWVGATGKSGGSGPQQRSFDLLGFTHYWGRSRKGNWVIKRKTASNRLSRALHKISQWCRRNRHRPVREQHHILSQKLRGHYAYYGITGNSSALAGFRYQVAKIWHKWLSRRHRGKSIPWERFKRLLERYRLPPTRVIHSV